MDRAATNSIQSHRGILGQLEAVLAAHFDPAVSLLAHAIVEGKKILICGNGGSASDASHFAAELVVRYFRDRRAYPAIALASDLAIVTACGNDYGYNRIFARQVEALGQAGDVLVALSTSGKSVNVLEAIATAKRQGMATLGLSGANAMGCDVDIAVPSTITARIQEMHILCVHLFVESLEARLPQ